MGMILGGKQRSEYMVRDRQSDAWAGEFGKEYYQRNLRNYEETDAIHNKLYGVSRLEMNREFLDELDRSINILEVGTHTGNQLMLLKEMGFENLYGIELNQSAIEHAKEVTIGLNIIYGLANDIPFKDRFFDLVFTSGVLIHIDPERLSGVIGEIYRCTSKFIWGLEYYDKELTEVEYRGNSDLLWKGDYARLYQKQFLDLQLVKEKKYKLLQDKNVDSMFLLMKQ